ncbi:SurA N-terminal domain-containing protein [Pseudoalteromonas luteoviolacea]|uniref:Periplasmic chaperone PpiD n=1 Tax=Pseudoalteromonas luteoviolacea H33 TaxID=1365251 RepID=A0A167FYT2_9GAMM|nr:SurA N-terminal domain-containing protein [Pseudoalteromonas luteoviolacea]KZN53378.1 peptidylprolyl isomerase [Pseudoalteromonas luteoviolacea H33]KZN76699.1 peptidylprolyl isomerase [Pseudoalteromonas luteoviolacea H33-S]MBQ4878852.1 SurA N-terminal domain-containing protein [Pseudoalteromonas luteoviolacea]MBQ4907971.1 SurA N-terminal domain-containing protein [Pseudoalteromonas luteoviolacea]
MLEKIREGSQGLAAKIVLGAVILSFALAGIGGYLGQTTEQPVAEVNGVKISQLDFARAFENERGRLEQQFGEYFEQIASDPTYMAQIRQGVVDRLVQQELQNQLAIELGLRVSDAQIKQAIFDMPYFQIGGQFSNDRYLQLIRQMNFQPDDFREYLREEMTRDQLVSAIAGSDFALDSEVKQTLVLQQQTRDVDYIVLDKEKLKSQVTVTESEIKDYYDLNQDQFMSPEQVALNYIELKASDMELVDPVTDEQVRAYYDENQAQYLEEERRRVSHILVEGIEDAEAAKAKAQDLYSQLQSGADFAELAQAHSDDVASGELGGDLDWIERDMMDPEFEAAAFALANVGDYSDVVESEFGFHIIQLTDLQAQEVTAFEEMAAELRAELEQNAKIDAFYGKQEEVRELAFEVADTLDDAAVAANLEVKTTELVARNLLPAPLNQPAVSRVIFTPELLEDGVNSEVIEVAPEHVVVVRVVEHKPAAVKSLEEVTEQITARLENEKASELAKDKAHTLFAQLEEGQSLSDIAAAESLEVKSEAALARQTYAVSPALVSKAFKMPHPAEGASSKAMVELNNGDAALLVVKAVNLAEVTDELEPQQKQSVTRAQVNKNYLALLNALEGTAEIVKPSSFEVTEEN